MALFKRLSFNARTKLKSIVRQAEEEADRKGYTGKKKREHIISRVKTGGIDLTSIPRPLLRKPYKSMFNKDFPPELRPLLDTDNF